MLEAQGTSTAHRGRAFRPSLKQLLSNCSCRGEVAREKWIGAWVWREASRILAVSVVVNEQSHQSILQMLVFKGGQSRKVGHCVGMFSEVNPPASI